MKFKEIQAILKRTEKDRTQISSYLMDLKPIIEFRKDWDVKYKPLEITQFKNACDLILAIGIEEHSGDWDPFLNIKLYDGTEIFTGHGYDTSGLTVNEDTYQISIEMEDYDPKTEEWAEQPKTITLYIKDIASIQMAR